MGNLFRLNKGNEIIKNEEIEEEKNHYKSVRVNIFWSNSYIEYKTNCEKNKTLSIKKYPN